MKLLNDVIQVLNGLIQPAFAKFTGTKWLGLAQTITRDGQGMPGVIDDFGEIKYIGVDDVAPIIIYHKSNNLVTSLKQGVGTGFGDNTGFNVYTFQNQLIAFIDRKKTGITADEFILLLQANLPDKIKKSPYRQLMVRLQNANISTAQVFTLEYPGAVNKLKPEQQLILINYQIEATFDKACLEKCA